MELLKQLQVHYVVYQGRGTYQYGQSFRLIVGIMVLGCSPPAVGSYRMVSLFPLPNNGYQAYGRRLFLTTLRYLQTYLIDES